MAEEVKVSKVEKKKEGFLKRAAGKFQNTLRTLKTSLKGYLAYKVTAYKQYHHGFDFVLYCRSVDMAV